MYMLLDINSYSSFPTVTIWMAYLFPYFYFQSIFVIESKVYL